MTVLTLCFLATHCNGWPKIRISIDNDIIEEVEFDREQVEVHVPMDLISGPHTLCVERYGKQAHNIEFVDNQILQDQTVTLVAMQVGDVHLSNMFLYRSEFCFDNQVIPGGLIWGPNGVWHWKFESPLMTWLIDQKNQDTESPDMVIPTHKNLSVLKTAVEAFKESWQ
jgi:hypothetical protein